MGRTETIIRDSRQNETFFIIMEEHSLNNFVSCGWNQRMKNFFFLVTHILMLILGMIGFQKRNFAWHTSFVTRSFRINFEGMYECTSLLFSISVEQLVIEL